MADSIKEKQPPINWSIEKMVMAGKADKVFRVSISSRGNTKRWDNEYKSELRIKGGCMMDIGKKYRITADGLNITLSKRFMTKPRDGSLTVEVYRAIGYYSSPSTALKALVGLEVRETELRDLRTVVAKLDEIYKKIDQAIGGRNEVYDDIRKGETKDVKD